MGTTDFTDFRDVCCCCYVDFVKNSTLSVGDLVEVVTERLAYGGEAVARYGGLAVFIPFAAAKEPKSPAGTRDGSSFVLESREAALREAAEPVARAR